MPALESLALSVWSSLSLGDCPLPALRSLKVDSLGSASLGPAVVPHLQSLILNSCKALSIPGAAPFSALRSLRFSAGQAAMLQELLRRAPALADLAFSIPGASDAAVANEHMQVLAAATNPVTKLSLKAGRSGSLPGIPAATCLAALEELQLDCHLAHLPPALAAATRLRSLDLARNSKLQISVEEVECVLAPMQHLTELRLQSWAEALSPPAAACLFRTLPLLTPPSSWDGGW